MRCAISMAMGVFGLVALVTGIQKPFPLFDAMFYLPHVISAFIFGFLAIVHIWLNRKAVARYSTKS
ncbi:hypothetical protein ACFLS8_05070 [Chloroflexota bacterium]